MDGDTVGKRPPRMVSWEQPQPRCKAGWVSGLNAAVGGTGDASATLKSGGEAESVVAVLLLVPGPVGPDAWQEEPAAARLPRVDDGVVDGPVEDPARVAPVQTLRPGCGARGGSAPALPSSHTQRGMFWGR